MYIVLYPSQSERANGPDVEKIEDLEKLKRFLLTTKKDLGRVEIYEATKLTLQFGLETA